MIKDVALIGLGIVGQIALEELSGCNLSIAVIDEINTKSEFHFLRDINGSKSVWTRGSRVSGFPGGRLNWGKNCSFATIQNYPPLGEEIQSQLPQLSKRLRKYGFPKLRLVEINTLRADKYCVREAEDFLSKRWISKIETIQNIEIVSGLATNVIRDPNGLIKIQIRKADLSICEVVARRVLICAGPFGTQELLADSGLLPDTTPQIRDHISLILGVIPLRKVRLSKLGLFGWNRYRRINIKKCHTFYDVSNKILWSLRIFPEGVIGIEKAFAIFRRKFKTRHYLTCISLIASIFGSFITGKFLYDRIKVHISADYLDVAGSISCASYGEGKRIDFLEYESRAIPLSEEFQQFIYKTIDRLRLDLNENPRHALIKEIDFEDITSSSHHMCTVKKNSTTAGNSPLEVSPNILVAGSSIFQTSVPGHPTMLAAATALVAADQIRSQLT